MSGKEQMIKIRCFNENEKYQIPKSSIDFDAWHMKDTIISSLVKRGTTEFFIHTNTRLPLLMMYIHKAKNPGVYILDEICAPDLIKDMVYYGIITEKGEVDPIVFRKDDIICNPENKKVFIERVCNRLKTFDKTTKVFNVEINVLLGYTYKNSLGTFKQIPKNIIKNIINSMKKEKD